MLASGPVPTWAELRVALMAMSEMVLMVRRPMAGRQPGCCQVSLLGLAGHASAARSLCSWRSCRLRILPLGFFGMAPAMMTRLGVLYPASSLRV